MADVDGDGNLDVYLIDGFGWTNRFFRNNGDKTFSEATNEVGLGDFGSSRMGLFADLDNDGDPDLILGNDTQGYAGLTPSRVFRNQGGTFVDVTAGSGFAPQGVILGGMATCDYNDDGLLDIYVTHWDVLDGSPFNYLYENRGNFTFADRTVAVGLRTPVTQVQSWSPVFVDLDDDGDQDLFTAVDFDLNYFFVLGENESGSPQFFDHSINAHVFHCCNDAAGNDMGVALGDIEGDGDLDIFTTNLTLSPPNEQLRTNALLVNNGLPNQFADEAVARGVWQSYWGWGAVFLDADLDADLDLITVNGRGAGDGGYWSDRPSQFFLNDGAGVHGNSSGYFTEMAEQAGIDHPGNSRGLVAFDYDNDGDQDVLISNVAQPAVLFENTTPRANRWLSVALRGSTRNRDAIGAKVRVTANGQTQLREIVSGSSFYSSPPLDAHFGLSNAPHVERLEILWPGGARTELVYAPVDQRITLTEGAAPPNPVPRSLSISGPTSIGSGGTYRYAATAGFWYAADSDVADQVTWTVSPADAAVIDAGGILAASLVDADRIMTIRAQLAGLETTLTVTIQAGNVVQECSAPVVVVPTSGGAFSTIEPIVLVSGTLTDSGAAQRVSWTTVATDGSCSLAGANWACADIPLGVGDNSISIITTCFDGLAAETSIAVIREQPAPSTLTVSPISLDFGSETDELLLLVSASGADIDYAITTDSPWVSITPSSGTARAFPETATEHVVSVNRTLLTGDQSTSAIVLVSSLGDDQSVSIAVAALPRDEVPTNDGPTDGGDSENDDPPADDLTDPPAPNPIDNGQDDSGDPSSPVVRGCGAFGAWMPFLLLSIGCWMVAVSRRSQGGRRKPG